MNYLQMFAKGGKTKGTDIIKGIQQILGVDDNQMAELWQVGINKYGSEEGIAQALNEATKGLSPQSSPDEVKAAVASVFSTGSEMFKCGGKLQRLTKRFAKGGSVDCGCGGIKVKSAQPGAKLISDDKSITILNPYTELADTTGHYSYPSTNGRFRLSPEGRTADVWDNTGGFATRYADENWIKNNPIKQRLPAVLGGHRKLATQDYWNNLIQRVNNRFQNVPKPTETLIITENPEGKGTVAHIPMNQDGGYLRASGYYKRHANEGIIRKIQMFLASHGYDIGETGSDGIFGRKTYEAIRKYQRDNGLKDDGMWGEDTNLYHRVLGAGETTFTGPRSGAHAGTHTFGKNYRGTSYASSGNVTYSQINNAIEKAIQNPEWFWGDSNDAKQWRLFFQKGTPDGKGGTNYGAILQDIYDSTPDEIRNNIDLNKLPAQLKQNVYNQRNIDKTNAVAPAVATAIAAPLALTNPIATAGAVVGGHVGGLAGRQIGSDISWYDYDTNGNRLGWRNQNKNPETSVTGAQIPVVRPDKGYEGEATGKAIGSVLGATAADILSNVNWQADLNHNPTNVSKAGKIYIDKPNDFDIDKVYFNTFDKSKILDYIKNTKFTK